MSDEAFARRFYSDRAELTALGVPLQSQRDEFTGEELYTLRSENYFLDRLELDDDELAALQTALYYLEGKFAYAEPLRLALQNLALGRVRLRRAADRDGRARARERTRLLAGARRPAVEARVGDLEAANGSLRILEPTPSTTRRAHGEPVRASPRRRQLVRRRARPRARARRRTFKVSRIRGDIRFATRRERDFRIPADFDVEKHRIPRPWQIGEIGRNGADRGLRRHRVVGRAHALRRRHRRGRRVRDRVRERRAARGLGPPAERPRRAARAGRARRGGRRRARAPRRSARRSRARSRRAEAQRIRGSRCPSGPRARSHPSGSASSRRSSRIFSPRAATSARRHSTPPSSPRRFSIPLEELQDHLSLLNLVNFGGGCYAVYAEHDGDVVRVDKELYGDVFRRPPKLTPLEARAIRLAIEYVGPTIAADAHTPLEARAQEARRDVRPLRSRRRRPSRAIASDEEALVKVLSDGAEKRVVVEIEYLKEGDDSPSLRRVEPYTIERELPVWRVHTWDLSVDARADVPARPHALGPAHATSTSSRATGSIPRTCGTRASRGSSTRPPSHAGSSSAERARSPTARRSPTFRTRRRTGSSPRCSPTAARRRFSSRNASATSSRSERDASSASSVASPPDADRSRRTSQRARRVRQRASLACALARATSLSHSQRRSATSRRTSSAPAMVASPIARSSRVGSAAGVASVALASAARSAPGASRRAGRVRCDPPAAAPDDSRASRSSSRTTSTALPAGRGRRARPCDVRGTRLRATPARSGAFRRAALVRSIETAAESSYVARVPDALAERPGRIRVLRGARERPRLSERLVVPAGGADAPQAALPLERPGRRRARSTRVRRDSRARRTASSVARWGDGPADVGLEQGRNLAPIGASAFDVDGDRDRATSSTRCIDGCSDGDRRSSAGSRSRLDRRHARRPRGRADGSIYVLESRRAPGSDAARATLRRRRARARAQSRRPSGRRRRSGSGRRARRARAAVAASGCPCRMAECRPRRAEQRRRGRSGRRFRDGRRGRRAPSRERAPRRSHRRATEHARSWRMTSDTPLAEVQLAEPLGARLVLVVRVYTDDSRRVRRARARIGTGSSSDSHSTRPTGPRPRRSAASASSARPSTSSARRRPEPSSTATTWRCADARVSWIVRRRLRRRRSSSRAAGTRGRVPHALRRRQLQLRRPDADVVHHARRLGGGRAPRPVRGLPVGGRLLERQRPRRLAERPDRGPGDRRRGRRLLRASRSRSGASR